MTRPSSLLIVASLAALCACNQPPATAQPTSAPASSTETATMNVVLIQSPNRQWTVRLNDSAAARDFLALLPLKLELGDHADTEKVADLPRKLSRDGAPASATPRAGDVAYYAPWGNLAIYHKDFSASPGLIILGHIEGTTDGLERPGPLQVTVTRVAQPAISDRN